MKFISNVTFSEKKILINGPLVIKPKIINDERGYFKEDWNEIEWIEILENAGQKYERFVQDNFSYSKKGVLRGLHYQNNPFSQSKLVKCLHGKIYDVAVDVRINSPTFGEWIGQELSESNHKQLWIPSGFAHGFLTLTDFAYVSYKVTNYWSKESEQSVLWNDEDINIKWPNENKINLSEKDLIAPKLKNINKKNLFK